MKILSFEVKDKHTTFNILGFKLSFKSTINKYAKLIELLEWITLSFLEAKELLEEIKANYNSKKTILV